MSTEPRKPLIVISYAHEDEPEKLAEGEIKWLSFVTGYLRPAIKHGAVDLWLDRLMPGGADWEREIEQKLRACDIFILLISRHSLSSDYVVDKEIALIRERQAKGDAVHFYPLVLTPTPKIALDLEAFRQHCRLSEKHFVLDADLIVGEQDVARSRNGAPRRKSSARTSGRSSSSCASKRSRRRSEDGAGPSSGASRHPRVFARGQALLPTGEGMATVAGLQHLCENLPSSTFNEFVLGRRIVYRHVLSRGPLVREIRVART
jgi:TIR domain